MNFDPFRVVEDEVPLSQKGEPMKETPSKARETPIVETVEEPKVDKPDDKDAGDMFAVHQSPMDPPLKDAPVPDLPEPKDLPLHLCDQGVNEDWGSTSCKHVNCILVIGFVDLGFLNCFNNRGFPCL